MKNLLWVFYTGLVLSKRLTKTVIITGANRGIGYNAVRSLLGIDNYNFRDKNNCNDCDWEIILACRDAKKGNQARASILTEFLSKKGIAMTDSKVQVSELDLTDLRSIRQFALSWGKKPISCLALNAGIQSSVQRRTVDGFESTVGTNHIGHFYLLSLLLPNVKAAPSGRVVIVGSGVHNPGEPGGNVGSPAGLGDFEGLANGFKDPIWMIDGSKYDSDKTYKDSKLCNVVTSLELSRRLKNTKVTCNCMNPGLIPTTGLFREFNPVFVFLFSFLTKYVFKVAASEEEGGNRLAYLIASNELNGVSGKYFSGRPGQQEFEPIPMSAEAQDPKTGQRLWTLTEQIIKNAIK